MKKVFIFLLCFFSFLFLIRRDEIYMYLEKIEHGEKQCTLYGSYYNGKTYQEYQFFSDSCSAEIGWVVCDVKTLLYGIENKQGSERTIGIVFYCRNLDF